jgi:hypothetical protein
MTAFDYLTKHRDEWLNKPAHLQRKILDELCNDWAKNHKGKDHGAFFDAANNPDCIKYWNSL